MRKAHIYCKNILAGELIENENGYTFMKLLTSNPLALIRAHNKV